MNPGKYISDAFYLFHIKIKTFCIHRHLLKTKAQELIILSVYHFVHGWVKIPKYILTTFDRRIDIFRVVKVTPMQIFFFFLDIHKNLEVKNLIYHHCLVTFFKNQNHNSKWQMKSSVHETLVYWFHYHYLNVFYLLCHWYLFMINLKCLQIT